MPLSIKNAALLCTVAFAAVSAEAGGRRGQNGLGTRRGNRGSKGDKPDKPEKGSKNDKGDKAKKDKHGKGRGRGKGKGKGKGGIVALEKIEACQEDIVLTCALDFDFDLSDLTDRLAEIGAAKEAAREQKAEERENRHAAVVEACPDLVDYCGLPLTLPALPEEGEKPDRKAAKEIKKAMKCMMKNKGDVAVSDACADVLTDLREERDEHKQSHANGESEHPKLDEELKEMMNAVRVCLQEDIKPNLDEDSLCLAALTRPDKEKEGEEEEDGGDNQGQGERPEISIPVIGEQLVAAIGDLTNPK
jgi:hypothetical protein